LLNSQQFLTLPELFSYCVPS